jgi:hypothetical protein
MGGVTPYCFGCLRTKVRVVIIKAPQWANPSVGRGCILGHVDSPRPIKVSLGENLEKKAVKRVQERIAHV